MTEETTTAVSSQQAQSADTPSDQLQTLDGIEAAEDELDARLGDLEIARAILCGEIEIARRVKDRKTLNNTIPGLAYSREEATCRKVYVHNHTGVCDVECFASREDYMRGTLRSRVNACQGNQSEWSSRKMVEKTSTRG